MHAHTFFLYTIFYTQHTQVKSHLRTVMIITLPNNKNNKNNNIMITDWRRRFCTRGGKNKL